MGAPMTALADSSGSSSCERVFVHGTGTWVDYVSASNLCGGYYGHHHIYASNGKINSNNANKNPIVTYTVAVSRDIGRTSVCAEGWEYITTTGSYALRGRPCVSVN